MCGRYVVKNPVTKTNKLVKSAIQVEDTENYNAHPYQKLPVIKKYKNADDIVWAQEEPINMWAYAHLLINLKEASSFRIASRRFYAATAAGSSARYLKRHQEVIDYIFDKNKNNQLPQ